MRKILFRPIGLLISMFCLSPLFLMGQLERKLADEDPLEELIFHAPRHINLMTVEPLEEKGLHFAIMHTFNTLDNGARNLWGLDNGANIRLSFEYGFSSRFSGGFGRSSRDKVFDFFGRYHILRQSQSGSMPVSVSIMGIAAVNSNDYAFVTNPPEQIGDRMSYGGQLMIARKFSKAFSLQVSPLLAYINNPLPVYQIDTDDNFLLALAFSGKYKITGKTSITAQYIPNLTNDLRSNWGLGVDIEAGGHVFQMYFVTNPALNEPYLIATENGVPGEQFRLGFNVNRIFALGKRKQ